GGCSSSRKRSLRIDPTTTSSSQPTTTVPAPTTTTAAPSSTTAPSPTTSASPAGALTWTSCGGGFECATARPPLDWDHPDGRTAQVSVIRLRASGAPAQRVGALFVNPG